MAMQESGGSNVVQLPASAAEEAAADYKPSSPYRVVVIGGLIILLAFGGVGIWAATAPLDSAARAPGTVTVESNRKIIQHLDGGIVREILVRDGEVVDKGELLLRLDSTESQARRDSVRHKLDSALALHARLVAERDGLGQIAFPEALTRRESDSAIVREAIAGERNQFAERRQSIEGRISIQREKIAQFREEIAGLEAQRYSRERQVEILRNELVDLRAFSQNGFFPRSRILQRERELARLEGEIGSNTAGIARARNRISEARLQIQQIQQEFNEKVVQELRQVEDKISDLREQLVITSAKLGRTQISAPQNGVVQNLQVHTLGAVIKPGAEIMQVIPVQDSLIIEAEVTPNDIDIVSQGQVADVRLTALQSRTTPTLKGEVITISADRIVEEGRQNERAYYSARIEIPAEELKRLGTQKLQAGMPAEVMINTGERTVLDYMIKPLTDAMARGFIEK